jgi:hypothetical protein
MKDDRAYKVSDISLFKLIIGAVLSTVSIWFIVSILTAVESHGGWNLDKIFAMVVAAGLAFFGFQMAFQYTGVIVNKSSRAVTQWSFFALWRRKTEYSFDSVREVTLSKKLIKTRDGTSAFYPVVIEGEHSIKLPTFGKYNLSRRHAEKIAELIGVPLIDTTTGVSAHREPGDLDAPLFRRIREAGITGEIPEPPPGSGITIERQPGEVRIIIPCRKWDWKSTAAMVFGIPILFAGIVFLFMLIGFFASPSGGHNTGCLYGFLAFLGCAIGYALVAIASLRGMGRQIITINMGGLSLKKVSAIARERFHQPMDELEELASGMLANTTTGNAEQGIIARSDKKSVMIGETLGKDERRWLLEAMMNAMAGLQNM